MVSKYSMPPTSPSSTRVGHKNPDDAWSLGMSAQLFVFPAMVTWDVCSIVCISRHGHLGCLLNCLYFPPWSLGMSAQLFAFPAMVTWDVCSIVCVSRHGHLGCLLNCLHFPPFSIIKQFFLILISKWSHAAIFVYTSFICSIISFK